jgi:hypothetical protein
MSFVRNRIVWRPRDDMGAPEQPYAVKQEIALQIGRKRAPCRGR